ncbi:septum formation protein [Pseudooceanicola antarcticus]|uniref:Nucleoside triphosphate pyrophosphatase n=1 Tax=Pseudooceanicola antarcticus TaxID=1247613 RepID=A0A285HT97_9RHOB|nr:Maf family protein [Pseudooceanicola antarcticus]PJE27557.1 septum formation protein Maf [Pseudooceanicola antarcticus]SNY38922.1 septum formation protein [Pseudooceanicola antarcticus]
MPASILLASGSEIRAELLRRAAVPFEVQKARVDEEAIQQALLAEGESPRDIADALAEAKAAKVGRKHPESFVIGCDQTCDIEGQLLGKPESPDAAREQIMLLAGRSHKLHSAAVIFHKGKPVWRKLSTVKLTMRIPSPEYLDDYITRNWPEIGWSCGAYQLEAEGARLMTRVEGDYFAVLGLPLLEILDYLALRGAIAS